MEAEAQSLYKVDYPALDHAFSRYLTHPGTTAAAEILRLLPSGHADTRVPDGGVTDKIYNQLEKLDVLASQGRTDAIDVAFALFAISDGAFAEDLSTLIAKAIEVNPRAFLRGLKNNPDYTCEIACDTGVDEDDDSKAALAKLKRRLQLVTSVKDAALTNERECTVAALRECIEGASK